LKKKILLSTLICLFSAQLLLAQATGGPTQGICALNQASPSSSSTQPGTSTQSGSLTSTCPPPGDPTPTPTPFPTPTPTPVTGTIDPKFIVLTVTYAPPGSASNVTYSNSTLLGTSSSVTNSFTNDVTVTASITTGFSLFGFFNSSMTNTASTQLSQETDTTSTVAVNETTNMSTTIRGPSSSAVGLDHDEDIIWVWLNPVVSLDLSSSNFVWNGYGFDLNDPAGTTDIIGIPVKFLNGHAPMPANIADVLARRWAPRTVCETSDPACGPDGTKDPGLDANDLAAILHADPFTDPSYVINIPAGGSCTADARFCRTTNSNLQYSPPPPGGQPITQTYSMQHQATQTEGQGATNTYKVGIGTQGDVAGSFFIKLKAHLNVVDNLTWQNKWNAQSTNQTGQTASASITGPSAADNYTGPVEFEIFQDNIYGTFMFGFIPQPTFNVFASPSSQSVQQGSCTNYTASVSALVSGFSSTVSFSVSGLPANTTASFSPASISGAGSSTLTVCTTASTPVATSTLTISGASGIEVHSTSVSLSVTAPPPPPQPGDFSLGASPDFLEFTAGTSGFSTISVSPLNGFNGTVSLTVDGGGLPASLSSTSVTGSGSVTLTVRSSRFTAPGDYQVPVTGTSGNLSHSAFITVTIDGSGGCSSTGQICQIQ